MITFLKEKIYRPIFQIGLRNYRILRKNKVSFQRLLVQGRIWINNSGSIQIGNNVVIHSGIKHNVLGELTGFEVYSKANLIIGDGVNMSNAKIRCEKEIRIDNDVMLGGGVTIVDSNCHSLDFNERMFSADGGKIVSVPIHIKRGAFVGTGAIILKGVTIGEEAIVAAGSVVTCDIPDHEIWGGNPAKLLKKR